MGCKNISRQEYYISRVKLDPLTGCVLWTGTKRTNGYARFANNGVRNQYGHRVAFEIFNGPIPKGKVVRHACDNPLCVNPGHLEIGTQADNMKDRFSRGRKGKMGKVPQEIKDKAAELMQAGMPIYKVAISLGISDKTVRACFVPKQKAKVLKTKH
jgi:hypothetical protein